MQTVGEFHFGGEAAGLPKHCNSGSKNSAPHFWHFNLWKETHRLFFKRSCRTLRLSGSLTQLKKKPAYGEFPLQALVSRAPPNVMRISWHSSLRVRSINSNAFEFKIELF
jgi:hypothetical protein